MHAYVHATAYVYIAYYYTTLYIGFKLIHVGVPIVLPNSSTIYCHAMLLCSTCDLPARALVMNMTQFNGFFGCCHCLQKGNGAVIA